MATRVVFALGLLSTVVGCAPRAASPAMPLRSEAHVEARGCTFTSGVVDVVVAIPTASRPAFVELYDANAQVTLGVDGGASSMAADAEGFHFDGAVGGEGRLDLFARVPLALGGVYDPREDVPLLWQMTSAGLAVTAPSFAAVRTSRDLTQRVGCDDVDVAPHAMEARKLPTAARIATNVVRLEIAPRIGAPAAAELEAEHPMSVVKEGERFAFVWTEDESGVWFGWVPRVGLGSPKPSNRTAEDFTALEDDGAAARAAPRCIGPCPSSRGFARPSVGGQRWTCSESMPLYAARVGMEMRARVGEIRAGSVVALEGVRPGEPFRRLVRVQRPRTSSSTLVRAADGFELLVDAALAAKHCSVAVE